MDDPDDWEALGEGRDTQYDPSKDAKIADLCLQGFSGAIRVASLFKMETERDAFVSSMAKLTGLSHVSEMKPKNVKAIKTIIGLAHILGEYLDKSWTEIMKVVSAVERLQLAWSTATATDQAAAPPQPSRPSKADTRSSTESRPYRRNLSNASELSVNMRRSSTFVRSDDLVNALSSGKMSPGFVKVMTELSSQVVAISIDKIFSNTVSLSSNAIIYFFRALCLASLEEVGLESSTAGQSVPSTPLATTFSAVPEGEQEDTDSALSGPPRMWEMCLYTGFFFKRLLKSPTTTSTEFGLSGLRYGESCSLTSIQSLAIQVSR